MRSVIIAFAICSSLFGLSKSQIQVIEKVKSEARKYTNYPTTIAAICMVESSAGANKNRIGDDGTSYGVMQIKVDTVRWLATQWEELRWTKSLSDMDVARMLLTRIDFSVMVASLRFEQVRKYHGYFKAVSAYNGTYVNYRYVRKVNHARRVINETR